MSSKVVCDRCGNDKFDYDSVWKEYTCSSCGWIVDDDSKIEILDKAPKSTSIEDSKDKEEEFLDAIRGGANLYDAARDLWGVPELIRAVEDNDLNKVRSFLEAGADPNERERGSGSMTALMTAAITSSSRIEVAKTLIEFGADVNLTDKGGWSALFYAAINGDHGEEIIRLLLEAGADVNLTDKDGWSALFHAEKYGHTKIVELLKKTPI